MAEVEIVVKQPDRSGQITERYFSEVRQPVARTKTSVQEEKKIEKSALPIDTAEAPRVSRRSVQRTVAPIIRWLEDNFADGLPPGVPLKTIVSRMNDAKVAGSITSFRRALEALEWRVPTLKHDLGSQLPSPPAGAPDKADKANKA